MEALIATWAFAESHGWLAAFGLLCVCAGVWKIWKKGNAKLSQHDVAIAKIDAQYDAVLHHPAGAPAPVVLTRGDLYKEIQGISHTVEDKMCTTACPVFPKIVENLERTSKVIEDFIQQESEARREMFRIVEDNYKRNDVFMNSTIAKFVVALEHLTIGNKGEKQGE